MSAKTSYEITTSTQITKKPGHLCAVTGVTNGSSNAVVTVYDTDAAASIATTNKLAEFTVVGANHFGGRTFVEPLRFMDGLYVALSGTGASAFTVAAFAPPGAKRLAIAKSSPSSSRRAGIGSAAGSPWSS